MTTADPELITDDRYCPNCGYNLRGLTGRAVRCPECFRMWLVESLVDVLPQRRISTSQWTLAGLIAGVALFMAGYKFLEQGGLKQTAALFIGLPALLSICITLAPRARSVVGIALKGTTIALLVSGVFLGEGFICILMMSPLFYAVAMVVAFCVIGIKRAAGYRSRGKTTLHCLLLVPVLLSSMEGIRQQWSFSRREVVRAERIVTGTPEQVQAALASTPVFDQPLPLYLSLGFPKPARTAGEGLAVGDHRRIWFAGGEGRPGVLQLRVSESVPGRVIFDVESDTSHISTWLTWHNSEVTWTAVDEEHTRVTWTLTYDRLLDPAWYFGPWQRYANRLAAGYLIDTLAAP